MRSRAIRRALVVAFALAAFGCADSGAYQKAKTANTVEAYAAYLKEYPRGTYLRQAHQASITLKATDLAGRAKAYFDDFRESNDKAPSGFALLTMHSDFEMLAPEAAEFGAPDLARALGECQATIGEVVKENMAYLNKLSDLTRALGNDVRPLNRYMEVQGGQYLKYWDAHRAGVMRALDAFYAAVSRTSPSVPAR